MRKLILIVVVLAAGQGFSQNLMGAYIGTRGDHSDYYMVTITLDLMLSPYAAPPTGVYVNCGDGTIAGVGLTSSTTTAWARRYHYEGYHVYPVAPATYTITYHHPAREAGIRNMQNSASQPLEVKTSVLLGNGPPCLYWGIPLTNPPDCFLAGTNLFSYSPGGYTAGDSISYALGACTGAGYYVPSGTTFNTASGLISINIDTSAVYALKSVVKLWRNVTYPGPRQVIATNEMDFLVGMKGYTDVEENITGTGKVNLFPNPFQNNLNLECNAILQKIRVLNNLGETVFEMDNPSWSVAMNFESLAAGVYFVELSSKDKPCTYNKVVKE